MKTELEVARDAVRSAGLEELADALEWAAAAVKHRSTLLSAARWAAGESDSLCPDCGHRSVHDRKCPTAEALHVLDLEWSVEEVAAAHSEAAHWAPRRLWPMPALGGGNRIPPRPAFPPDLEAALRLTSSPEEVHAAVEAHYRRQVLHVDPDRLTYSAGTAQQPPFIPTLAMQPPWRRRGEQRVTMADGSVFELLPTTPAREAFEWQPASPQPAQPQPEDDVTPPASPPPAR